MEEGTIEDCLAIVTMRQSILKSLVIGGKLLPSQLPSLWREHKKLQSPWFCAVTALATAKALVCSQYWFSLKTRRQHHTRCYEEKKNQLCPSWKQGRMVLSGARIGLWPLCVSSNSWYSMFLYHSVFQWLPKNYLVPSPTHSIKILPTSFVLHMSWILYHLHARHTTMSHLFRDFSVITKRTTWWYDYCHF